MNLLDVISLRIKQSFPDITYDELQRRVNYAYQLLRKIQD